MTDIVQILREMQQEEDCPMLSMAANAIAHAAEMTQETIRCVASNYERPSVLFRPKLSVDGDQWCAMYGDDLQSGVGGFGDSPEKAMYDFDRAWCATLA